MHTPNISPLRRILIIKIYLTYIVIWEAIQQIYCQLQIALTCIINSVPNYVIIF